MLRRFAVVCSRRYEIGAPSCRGMGAAAAITLLATLLCACEAPFEVVAPQRFDPPASYERWWAELEVCVGLERDFDQIRWYSGESIMVDDRPAYGLWVAPDVIIMKQFYVTSETAVKHEMLHHLSHGSLPHDHPAFARCTTARSAQGTR